MELENYKLKKLVSLVKIIREIEGRTKFHKMVYILKNKEVSFNEKFKYHNYGPYSPDLQLEIDELVDRKILIETVHKPYKYSVNNKLSDDNFTDTELYSKNILIQYLSDQDSQDLELVSTIYFLRNNMYSNNEAIKDKLEILKPHLSDRINKAFIIHNEIENNF